MVCSNFWSQRLQLQCQVVPMLEPDIFLPQEAKRYTLSTHTHTHTRTHTTHTHLKARIDMSSQRTHVKQHAKNRTRNQGLQCAPPQTANTISMPVGEQVQLGSPSGSNTNCQSCFFGTRNHFFVRESCTSCPRSSHTQLISANKPNS